MTILDTLIEIVSIPSVTGEEDQIADFLAARYQGTYRVERVGKSVIVGARPSTRSFVALYGHTDTVPVQGDPSPRIDGDRLIGLGTSDMKAGLAVMMELLDNPRAGAEPIVCVFYAAEEGAAANNEMEPVLDACSWLTEASLSIVLEPTDLNLEMGCNGVLNADIVFEGKSAHSARPWLGENAVTKAGEWLSKLHSMEPEAVDIDGLVYREVFSVTQGHGGIANNIIPPQFVINLNHRFPPIYTLDEAEARLRSVAQGADAVIIRDSAPAGSVAPSGPRIDSLANLVPGERTAKQGWTDVARLTERGAVAVNFGPGEVAQAHQVDESVPIANVAAAYDVLVEFLGTDRG